MSMEDFIDSKKNSITIKTNTSLEGNVVVSADKQGIDISKVSSDNDNFYSPEATLVKMIETANKKKYKALIGVDDISKTTSMVELLSMISSIILEGFKIYAYDLIWKSISSGEKDFIRCIFKSGSGKTNDVKELMTNKDSYSVLRERLINKHIVNGDSRGYLSIKLPRFDKYVKIWGDD